MQIFPDIPGIQIEIVEKPEFKTNVQTSMSGFEARQSFRQYPLTTFTIPIGAMVDEWGLTGGSVRQVMNFYNARRGPGEAFLFKSPRYKLGGGLAGVSDGIVTTYGPLSPAVTDAGETIVNYDYSTIAVYVRTRQAIPYVVGMTMTTGEYYFEFNSTTLVITLNQWDGAALVPVATGANIYWGCEFYYQVRFVEDSYDFNRLSYDTYDAELSFIGAVSAKV